MLALLKSTILGAASAFVASGAVAATCAGQQDISIELAVREAPIVIMQDIRLADLMATAARLGRQPAHRVLGFYAGIVGYKLVSLNALDTPPPLHSSGCPVLQLKAEFVVVDRRLAVASDIADPQCRSSAFEHYRHHAAAASLALHRFAIERQAQLKPAIEQRLRPRASTSVELRKYIDALLDEGVGDFNASIVKAQKDVDSENEIQILLASCNKA